MFLTSKQFITFVGDDRHSFRSLSTNPVDITSLDNHLFWVNKDSNKIYWGDKKLETIYNQKFTLSKFFISSIKLLTFICRFILVIIKIHRMFENFCDKLLA